MAVKTAQRFIEALENQATLSTQFSIVSPTNLDAVVDFAWEKGYEFTKDELEAALKLFPENRISHIRHAIR
ncbi:MAG: Nif11-like leader peptide family natural product precursor [Anaerolineae bacterium]|nr:Nif11-like leader peptide family natural product precursor [Anaerolineae bacterium]